VASLAKRLGLRRPVRLMESAALVGPIAFGWWRPTIGLPQGFFARHSQAEQDTMLAHELAHLAARDPLWLALADALSAALWWHPAVWWLRRQFRVASETAADDASLLVQDGPVILADCLVSLAAQLQTRRATGWLGMAEFRSGLGRRVERLLRLRPEEAKTLGQKARWVAPALVSCVLLGLAATAWAFPNSRSEGPTLFALVQEAIGPEPLQESDLPRRRIVQLPGTTVHNSLTGFSVSDPAEEVAAEGPRGSTPRPTGSSTAAQSNLPPTPESSSQTNRTQTMSGRQRLRDALERIRFKEMSFDNLPLEEVVTVLGMEAKRAGPEQEVIAFLVHEEMPPAASQPGSESQPAWTVTNSTLPVLSRVRITVRPPLKQASLGEVLDAIVKGANWPIEYSVEELGIAFSAQWSDAGPLQSRTFKLDWQRLRAALGVTPGLPAGSFAMEQSELCRKLDAVGWTLGRGKGEIIFLKPPDHGQQVGLLFVRAAPTNVDLVESVVRKLNVAAEPDPDSARPAPNSPSTGQEQSAPTEKAMPLPTQAATDSEAGEKLYSRTFKLDWKRLAERFGDAPGALDSIPFGQYLASAGWTPGLTKGEAMFMKPPNLALKRPDGLLYVRTTMANLDLVEGALRRLNIAAEPDAGNARPASANPVGNQEWLAATNSEAGGQLFSRTYKVDFHALSENIANATGQGKTNALSTHEALDWYFRAAGWNRATNETFFLNEGSGVLFVRARQASLDAVDSILQVLTATTPQVLVQVKFIEVSQDDEKALGFDWYLGQVTGTPTNAQVPGVTSGIRGTAPGAFPGSGQSGGPGPTELRGDELDWAGRSATNAKSIRVNAMLGSQMTGILTEAQSRVVLKALEQRSGTDVLSAPSVTTLSGRQAQIQVVDMKTVATGTDPLAGTNAVTTAVIPCGPVLDVVPTVLADGVTVQVNVKASVTEFLGYDPAARGSASGPQPLFRLRELKTIANVWDGQTLILGGGMVELPGSSTNAATAGKVVRKQLFVFVTPTIVDPAGNRVHTHDEMPFSTNAVPPQPKPGK
jgi:hypothetical protein